MYMLKPYMQGKNYTYQLHLKKESEAHHRRLRNSTSQIKRLGLNKEPQRVSTANWNPKRRMQEDERFHEVEAENARLLQRMTRILEKPKKPDHFLNLFDARAYARAQEHKALLKENKLIWKRISETPSYYHAEEWDNERKKTEHVLRHMGLYPYTPPKQGKRKQKDNKKQEERDAAFLDTYWQRTMAAFSDAHPEIVAAAEAAQPTAQGGRASLPSLDRPSDDEWMLPGLGRPPRYSGFGSPPSTASTYSMRSRSASSHKPLRNSTPDAVAASLPSGQNPWRLPPPRSRSTEPTATTGAPGGGRDPADAMGAPLSRQDLSGPSEGAHSGRASRVNFEDTLQKAEGSG